MAVSFFLQGLIVGFSIAAPVSPIGVLCLRRSLSQERLSGFITGLGAATADACYGLVAAFGLTFISSFLVKRLLWLQLIGIVFLLFLGIKIFLEEPKKEVKAVKSAGGGLPQVYLSTFFLTITNPTTILSFAAIFAGLGLANTGGNYLFASFLVIGVFSGSAFWWFILSGSVGTFRKKIGLAFLRGINKISGVIIISFGVIIAFNLLRVFLT